MSAARMGLFTRLSRAESFHAFDRVGPSTHDGGMRIMRGIVGTPRSFRMICPMIRSAAARPTSADLMSMAAAGRGSAPWLRCTKPMSSGICIFNDSIVSRTLPTMESKTSGWWWRA